MKTIINDSGMTSEYELPACWASVLINNDGSSDGERRDIGKFLLSQSLRAEDCVNVSPESWFQWRNDWQGNVGTDVATFTFRNRDPRA